MQNKNIAREGKSVKENGTFFRAIASKFQCVVKLLDSGSSQRFFPACLMVSVNFSSLFIPAEARRLLRRLVGDDALAVFDRGRLAQLAAQGLQSAKFADVLNAFLETLRQVGEP